MSPDAALSCGIPKPGDYKAMLAAGLPILIARDRAGTVRAFLNACAYRWAPVAAEGYGNSSRFTCPFHGWTYRAAGKLISITEQRTFGEIDKSARGLRALPCEERHGLVFVCLTPDTQARSRFLLRELLEEYVDADLQN